MATKDPRVAIRSSTSAPRTTNERADSHSPRAHHATTTTTTAVERRVRRRRPHANLATANRPTATAAAAAAAANAAAAGRGAGGDHAAAFSDDQWGSGHPGGKSRAHRAGCELPVDHAGPCLVPWRTSAAAFLAPQSSEVLTRRQQTVLAALFPGHGHDATHGGGTDGGGATKGSPWDAAARPPHAPPDLLVDSYSAQQALAEQLVRGDASGGFAVPEPPARNSRHAITDAACHRDGDSGSGRGDDVDDNDARSLRQQIADLKEQLARAHARAGPIRQQQRSAVPPPNATANSAAVAHSHADGRAGMARSPKKCSSSAAKKSRPSTQSPVLASAPTSVPTLAAAPTPAPVPAPARDPQSPMPATATSSALKPHVKGCLLYTSPSPRDRG